MQQDARYEEIVRHAPRLNLSCNKLHATRKSVNSVSGLIHSCNKLHATGHRITHYHYITNKKSTAFSCRAFLLSEFTD
ncbi:hypothetical protein HMPREF9065_01650 [Aggregatibacter sp. oral taxon 458 str. W10330]|nr:hypothetical protein HMPREF9065_01650 [Aggregatibacter sp. oral taxon 458 str. W10330]